MAFDHAESAAARTGEIKNGFDRHREHRSLHELAALGAKHRLRLRILTVQALIDQRREILAARGCKFKTHFDWICR
jgi:hypothetical protein